MTKSEYFKKIGALRTKYQRSINNLYIWSTVAVDSLDLALNDKEFLNSRHFSVPSKNPDKTVKRTGIQVKTIIKTARDSELYDSVLSFLVAQGEAFFQEILIEALTFDEKKLKTRVQGVEHVKKIDINEIIDRRTRKALIDSIIEKEIITLFYAKPKVQFEYLEKVVDVELDQVKKESWAEIKATRDLIVHNSGTINKLYLSKSGNIARGKEGDKIPMDKEYIEQSMATLKSLVGSVCSRIQKNNKGNA